MTLPGQKSQNAKPRTCRRHHGEPIAVFSTRFERCMCLKCAKEQHKYISEFMSISEGAELMKSTGKSLLMEMAFLLDTTHTVKKSQSTHMEKMRLSDKSIRAQVRTIRDGINRHMDFIEHKLLNQLKQLMDKKEKIFLKNQHEIQVAEAAVRKNRNGVQACLKSSNEVDLISGIINARRKLEKDKVCIQTQEEHVPTNTLGFRPSSPVLDFTETVETFGDVALQEIGTEISQSNEMLDISPLPISSKSSVMPADEQQILPATSTPLSFPKLDSPRATIPKRPKKFLSTSKYGLHKTNPYHSLKRKTNHHSQEEVDLERYNDSENKDKESENQEVDVRDVLSVVAADHSGPCNLSGVAALTGDRLVVCDYKHKCIQLLNRQSDILDELMFQYKPCDITTISDNSVVVSFVEKDFITVFSASMTELTRKKDVSVSGRGGSYSVAYCKNKFAVCRRGEIRIVSSEDGTMISAIQVDAHFPQIAMSDGGSRIYMSDGVSGKVTCLSDTGKCKWEFSERDFEPCSVAIDLNQLFVADVKGKIMILSTYGVLVREIKCKGHLLAICADPNTGTLLVSQESNKNRETSRTIKIVSI